MPTDIRYFGGKRRLKQRGGLDLEGDKQLQMEKAVIDLLNMMYSIALRIQQGFNRGEKPDYNLVRLWSGYVDKYVPLMFRLKDNDEKNELKEIFELIKKLIFNKKDALSEEDQGKIERLLNKYEIRGDMKFGGKRRLRQRGGESHIELPENLKKSFMKFYKDAQSDGDFLRHTDTIISELEKLDKETQKELYELYNLILNLGLNPYKSILNSNIELETDSNKIEDLMRKYKISEQKGGRTVLPSEYFGIDSGRYIESSKVTSQEFPTSFGTQIGDELSGPQYISDIQEGGKRNSYSKIYDFENKKIIDVRTKRGKEIIKTYLKKVMFD